MNDLLSRFVHLLGTAHVITDAQEMAPSLTDWRGRYHGAALCVLRPGTAAEVAAAVALCAEANVTITPQGGNTGLVGGATPTAASQVVLHLTRLNRIRALDADNFTLTAEAGCTLAAVQAAAAAADRLFPLSLAAEGSATIGGNLATNAGGVHVLRYGTARDLTLGLEAVLPDGRLWSNLTALRKNNTGYDLKHLLIGAEGTLGIITAAVLKLFARPRSTALAWVAVTDIEAAVALFGQLRTTCGERLNALELINDQAQKLVLRHIPGARAPLGAPSPWALLIELADTQTDAPLKPLLENALTAASAQGLAQDAVIAASLAQAQALWALRENIAEAQKREGVSIKHDLSLPISRLAEFVRRAEVLLAQTFPGLRVVCFGHLGDGNLHYNLSLASQQDNDALIGQTPAVNRVVHDLAHELGGSISAEHGLGQLKREEILRYKSPLEMELMRTVKRALDPQGLMNPGKVLGV